MSATIEQSVETATKTIDISVPIVPGDLNTFSPAVADVTAKGMNGLSWAITWTLKPAPGISAHFRDAGIVFTSPLPGGIDDHQLIQVSEVEYRLTFKSNVTDVNVIRYDLLVGAERIEAGKVRQLVRDTRLPPIDPTISVVKNPIDG